MYNMVYILLCLAMASLQTFQPHSMASVVNMDILMPHSMANAVNAYCNNGHCASAVILFGYFWMATSVPHGTGM